MTNNQWKELLYAIRKGKCMLLLGAGASTLTKNGVTRPLTEWLALELSEQLRGENQFLEESETGSLLYVATEYLQHFKSALALQDELLIRMDYAKMLRRWTEVYKSDGLKSRAAELVAKADRLWKG